MKKYKPIVVITPGDPEGIGPEITWKALNSSKIDQKKSRLLVVGAKEPFQKMGVPIVPFKNIEQRLPQSDPFVWLLEAPSQAPRNRHLPGYQSGWSIECATRMVLKGQAAALATGPISKDRLQKGGYLFPGHTEFLAKLSGAKEVTMMLANEQLRVSLATTHVALKDVPKALTRAKIRRAVLQTAAGLRNYWGISTPKIALCALNPHAGENGRFGREEIEVIQPEIDFLNRDKKKFYKISGPFPADTAFANHILAKPKDRYDAIIGMYHDQGLIPVKLLDFPNTVNITLGLPMIRTSVDHGVGFDIAGKGVADPSSLCAAIRLANHFTQKRAKNEK